MKFENFRHKWEAKKYCNSFAKKTVVGRGCEIKKSNMGEYSRLKPYSELRNSTLGDYSIVSSFSIISATDIGKFNSIGPGTFIGLWEHNRWISTHSFYLSEACGEFVKGFKDYELDSFRASIGNDVWIGAGSIILKGKRIGDGAIIGAGTVVTKDVEPYAVVVGNPQRIIKYRFEKKDIDFLLRIKWWNFKREVIQDMVDNNIWDSIDKLKAYCKSRDKST